MHSRLITCLLILLAAKGLAMAFVILHAGIGLGPDEAQYWTWSRYLDWGYYSKPPGIAWEIRLGTSLFGNTELGVRSMPLLIGTLIPLAVYLLAACCRLSPTACFWAAASMALSPIGVFASLLAITDGGMVLFWTVACAYLAAKIRKHEVPNYTFIGLFILCGALFKWPAYFFWLILIASWSIFPWLASRKILLGFLVSLLALLPSIYWNSTHEWSTFKHVFYTMIGGHGIVKTQALFKGNAAEFIGSQAVLMSPILFVLFLFACWKIFRAPKNTPPCISAIPAKKMNEPQNEVKEGSPGKGSPERGNASLGKKNLAGISACILFCCFATVIILICASIAAIFMKLQGNWAIFAYPTAFVALSWYCMEAVLCGKKWLYVGTAFSVIACAFILAIPAIQSHSLLSKAPIPYRINPFRHNVGWNEMTPALLDIGYDPSNDFLFGDKYQTASILSFYGPQQHRAYFFNLQGARKNQFSFWPSMSQEQKGKRGFFVLIENIPQLNNASLINAYLDLLQPYFTTVRFLGIKPLFYSYGRIVKGALIFECTGYNGSSPASSNLF